MNLTRFLAEHSSILAIRKLIEKGGNSLILIRDLIRMRERHKSKIPRRKFRRRDLQLDLEHLVRSYAGMLHTQRWKSYESLNNEPSTN